MTFVKSIFVDNHFKKIEMQLVLYLVDDGGVPYRYRDEVESFINRRKCASFEGSVPEKMIS